MLSVADDSFLFLPVGADLLTVILVARRHAEYPIYVLAAAAGSTIGVFFLDLACRKGGEEGLKRLVKPDRFAQIKQRMERNAATMLVISCLAPPPFPFSAYIAAASAFQYPRQRLLGIVFVSRGVRFALVGLAAIYFGRGILRIASSPEFVWTIGIFIAICLIGSIFSVLQWIRQSRR